MFRSAWRFEIKGAFSSFWQRHPALFFSLCILLGTAAPFCLPWLLFLFLVALCSYSKQKQIWILASLCFFGAFFATSYRFPKITLPQEKIQGKGIFHIDEVKIQSSPFNKSILYKGTLKNFETKEKKAYHDLPCHIYLPLFGKRPPANVDYEITGTLCQKGDYLFVLKPEKKGRWIPIPSFFNLSEWRFNAKQSLSHYLKKEISDPRARSFLNALATGAIDERILSLEFGKVGLQHILAISGFHFALVALFLNFIFRFIFSYRISTALLIVTLTLYYLFLGNAPSIQRAYIAISLVAIGQLFSLRTSGLNALGVGLMIELLFNPLVVTQLSFQLTFLCTLAILLFYPLSYRAISLLLPERSYGDAQQLTPLDRHGYLLSSLLRHAFALNFAVHLISLPVTLFLFHKFPLLSIIYNLFFPVCVSFSMLLLFTSLFFAPWLPFLSHAIHAIDNRWTSMMLTLTSNPPAFLDFSLRTKSISLSSLLCFLAITFFFGIIFYEKEHVAKISV
ncbi:MAG: ComEC/Rec2 family competence protein [Rhabdochlamydiaceae bacterium]